MKETVDARLPQGVVTGVREGRVCRFDAIPYAQAPVGSLRFRPPVPAPWSGRLDATRPGPVAPQLPSRLRGAMGDFEAAQSEDCLHLTVWTPATDAGRRPVVVWLHGGAWQSGGGALDWYSGAGLAARGDVVVVAVNYRLAALGWLYVPGQPANLGLLDQELAIDWVIAHIDAFGGDPERITVMGQSAGAGCIAALMSRQPRFDRAILQSVPLGRGFRPMEQATRIGALFMEAAGAHGPEDLQRLPVDALLRAQQAPAVVEALKAEGANRSLFCPVADGDVLAAASEPALREATGRADVIVGYTRHEMAAFPGLGRGEASERLGDAIFGAPARQWAADARERGRSAWLYRFDFAPTAEFGACHCLELPFVFGTAEAFADAPMMRGVQAEDAARLTDAIQRAWIDFIRGGSPQWEQAPEVAVLA